MRALFGGQGSVREGGLYLECRRLDARLLRVGGVVNLGRVAMAFRPAQIHAEQHGGEVGSVHTAGLGADGNQGLTLVVLTRKQGAYFENLDRLLQSGESFGRLDKAGLITFLLPQLD